MCVSTSPRSLLCHCRSRRTGVTVASSSVVLPSSSVSASLAEDLSAAQSLDPPATVATVSVATESSCSSIYVDETVSVVDPWRGNSLPEAREVLAFTGRELSPSRAASPSMTSLLSNVADRNDPVAMFPWQLVIFSSPQRGCRKGPSEARSAPRRPDMSSCSEYMQRPFKEELALRDYNIKKSALL